MQLDYYEYTIGIRRMQNRLTTRNPYQHFTGFFYTSMDELGLISLQQFEYQYYEKLIIHKNYVFIEVSSQRYIT